MSDDAELVALGAVMAAIEPLDFDARDRVLDYARKRSSSLSIYKALAELTDMWANLTAAAEKIISGCKTCNGLRFKDGAPCPNCFALYRVVSPEGADEVLKLVASIAAKEKT